LTNLSVRQATQSPQNLAADKYCAEHNTGGKPPARKGGILPAVCA
jgi:hypothetical protein